MWVGCVTVDSYLQIHTALQPRRPTSTSSPPPNPQISYGHVIVKELPSTVLSQDKACTAVLKLCDESNFYFALFLLAPPFSTFEATKLITEVFVFFLKLKYLYRLDD
jgi:hypothetical protein